jgi:hypothetical protein
MTFSGMAYKTISSGGGKGMATMKNKPVSFNLDNKEDQKLLEHVKGIKNFSGYVKSLIGQELIKKPDGDQTPGRKITIKGGVVNRQ